MGGEGRRVGSPGALLPLNLRQLVVARFSFDEIALHFIAAM